MLFLGIIINITKIYKYKNKYKYKYNHIFEKIKNI